MRTRTPTPRAPQAASAEGVPAPSRSGSVVVDIGGKVGAAIVHVPPALAGREMEIRPTGGRWTGTHSAVRERHLNGTTQLAALFGPLPRGRYEVRVLGGGSQWLAFDVVGAEVTEARWHNHPSSPGPIGPPFGGRPHMVEKTPSVSAV